MIGTKNKILAEKLETLTSKIEEIFDQLPHKKQRKGKKAKL